MKYTTRVIVLFLIFAALIGMIFFFIKYAPASHEAEVNLILQNNDPNNNTRNIEYFKQPVEFSVTNKSPSRAKVEEIHQTTEETTLSLNDFLKKRKKDKISEEQIKFYIKLIGENKTVPATQNSNIEIRSMEKEVSKYLASESISTILLYCVDRNEFMLNYLNQNQTTITLLLELVNFEGRLKLIQENLIPTDVSEPTISVLLEIIKRQTFTILDERVSLLKKSILKERDEKIRYFQGVDLSKLEQESLYRRITFSKVKLLSEIYQQFTEMAALSTCLNHYRCEEESCRSYEECVNKGKISPSYSPDIDDNLMNKKPQLEIITKIETEFIKIKRRIEQLI